MDSSSGSSCSPDPRPTLNGAGQQEEEMQEAVVAASAAAPGEIVFSGNYAPQKTGRRMLVLVKVYWGAISVTDAL